MRGFVPPFCGESKSWNCKIYQILALLQNASEVIRAGLRLLEEEESKVVVLKQAIQEGIESGIEEDFDPEQFLQKLKAERSTNG